MNPQELFINLRYVKDIKSGQQAYTSKTGTLKKFTLTTFTEKVVREDQVWFKLSDFDEETQRKLSDMAISLEDLITALGSKNNARLQKKKDDTETILDAEGVRVKIDEDTLIFPIVGNLLPSDSVDAYTVEFVDGRPKLNPILVCWGCHWSELFTGQTKYKKNVFCLASDLTEYLDKLTEDEKKDLIDKMISLKDASAYLGLDQEDRVKKI